MSEPTSLHLTSASAATDAAWLAAADVATIAAGLGVDYRLIGGIAITLLVHHHHVDHLVPARETADADMGVGFDVLSDEALPEALRRAGYSAERSNRFARADDHGRRLVIDVLAPSYLGRLLTNQPHGAIVVDEVPGLAEALHLAPVPVSVTAALTDATDVGVTLHLPDARGPSSSRPTPTAAAGRTATPWTSGACSKPHPRQGIEPPTGPRASAPATPRRYCTSSSPRRPRPARRRRPATPAPRHASEPSSTSSFHRPHHDRPVRRVARGAAIWQPSGFREPRSRSTPTDNGTALTSRNTIRPIAFDSHARGSYRGLWVRAPRAHTITWGLTWADTSWLAAGRAVRRPAVPRVCRGCATTTCRCAAPAAVRGSLLGVWAAAGGGVEEVGDGVGVAVVNGRQDRGVDVSRRDDRRVAEQVLDRLQVRPGREGQTRGAVTQVMQAHGRHNPVARTASRNMPRSAVPGAEPARASR